MRTLCTRHRHHHRRHGNSLSRCMLGIVLGKICYHLIRKWTKCYALTFCRWLLQTFFSSFSLVEHCSGQSARGQTSSRKHGTGRASTVTFNHDVALINHCARSVDPTLLKVSISCLLSLNSTIWRVWNEELYKLEICQDAKILTN